MVYPIGMIYAGGFIGSFIAFWLVVGFLGEILGMGADVIKGKSAIPAPACDPKVCVAQERRARGENWL